RRTVAERSRGFPRDSARHRQDADTLSSGPTCRSTGRRPRMTTRPPDFDDLVGGEVPREERARLHRVHELLVQADQPPELSPELVDVIDLPPAPSGGYYMLWLSRNGKPVAPCGSFNTATANKETVVRLSAAYSFNGINGWIVTREVPGAGHGQVVMTTA